MTVLLLSLLLVTAPPADSLGHAEAPLATTADGRVSLVAPRRDARVELRGARLSDLAEAVLGSVRLDAVGAGQVTEIVVAFGIAQDGRLRTAVVSDPVRLARGGPRTLLDAFDDPALGFEDPSFGFEEALRSSRSPAVSFEDPSFGFEDPSFGFEDPSFGFDSPEEALREVWREGARAAGDGTVLVAAVMSTSSEVRVTGDALLVGLNVNEARPRTD